MKFLAILASSFLALGLGSFLAWLVVYLNFFNFPPPDNQSKFVKTCGELNGKEFTYQNIKSLGGQCYINNGKSVRVENCKENHVTNYLEDVNLEKLDKSEYQKFNISESGLDGAWVCSLKLVEGKMRAVPHFFYD